MNRAEWSDKMEKAIKENYPNVSVHLTGYVSPVFFVHLGDQGFGLAIMGE